MVPELDPRKHILSHHLSKPQRSTCVLPDHRYIYKSVTKTHECLTSLTAQFNGGLEVLHLTKASHIQCKAPPEAFKAYAMIQTKGEMKVFFALTQTISF